MPNIKYIFNRIRNMDYKRMFETAGIVKQRTGKNKISTIVDIIKCGFQYQAGYMDYLVFEFYNLTPAQRATYITRGVNNYYVHLLNPREYWHILEDKVEFLKRFNGFHGRDWLDLRETDCLTFETFCQQHPKIVVKPLAGTCGHGIEFFDTTTQDLPALYDVLKQNQQYLVEELIIQHPAINEIYPLSVNTLRLVTIRNHDTIHLVFSSMRIGNNGKKVDNLNSGGMAVIVDMDTGKISAPGADKEGNAYYEHPYTHKKLIGTEIPLYQQAVELVKKAALSIDELHYIGWDVAITEKGPLIIEANQFPGHDIYQFQLHLGPDKLGLKPRFDAAMKGIQ